MIITLILLIIMLLGVIVYIWTLYCDALKEVSIVNGKLARAYEQEAYMCIKIKDLESVERTMDLLEIQDLLDEIDEEGRNNK